MVPSPGTTTCLIGQKLIFLRSSLLDLLNWRATARQLPACRRYMLCDRVSCHTCILGPMRDSATFNPLPERGLAGYRSQVAGGAILPSVEGTHT